MSFPTDGSLLRRDDRRNRIPPPTEPSGRSDDGSAWLREAVRATQSGLMLTAGLVAGLSTAGVAPATQLLTAGLAALAATVSRASPASAAACALGAALPLSILVVAPPQPLLLLGLVLSTMAGLAVLGAIGRGAEVAGWLPSAMRAMLRGAVTLAATTAAGAWIGGAV